MALDTTVSYALSPKAQRIAMRFSTQYDSTCATTKDNRKTNNKSSFHFFFISSLTCAHIYSSRSIRIRTRDRSNQIFPPKNLFAAISEFICCTSDAYMWRTIVHAWRNSLPCGHTGDGKLVWIDRKKKPCQQWWQCSGVIRIIKSRCRLVSIVGLN